MEIEIFDVEHGACALVTADNGRRILIDCGHNTTTNWRPSRFLPARGIEYVERLVVSNYDEDHVTDLPELFCRVGVSVLSRNPSVPPQFLRLLKQENGMGRGIGTLAYMAGNFYNQPLPAAQDFGALQIAHYWNQFPEFIDENNLSLVTILRYHNLGVIFPGDIEKKGWLRLLERPDFRSALMGVNVFVASHHGRETGYCPEIFDCCFPEFVVFSDATIAHETQETAGMYRQHTLGVRFFDGKVRHVLSTRNNGMIRLTQRGAGMGFVWISKA